MARAKKENSCDSKFGIGGGRVWRAYVAVGLPRCCSIADRQSKIPISAALGASQQDMHPDETRTQ